MKPRTAKREFTTAKAKARKALKEDLENARKNLGHYLCNMNGGKCTCLRDAIGDIVEYLENKEDFEK